MTLADFRPCNSYERPPSGAYCFQEVVNLVKGISRQVIVIHSPDPKLFEQAIFILKEDAVGQEGVTDEALMKEAQKLIQSSGRRKKRRLSMYGPVWACGGAFVTGLVWLITSFL